MLLRGNSGVGRLGRQGVLRSALLIRLGDATDERSGNAFSTLSANNTGLLCSLVISLKAGQVGR